MGNRGERRTLGVRAWAALLAAFAAAGTGCHEVNKVAWTPELTVCGVSPSLGPMQGGTLVTAFGIAFQAGATVTVGGLLASSPTVLDASRIIFTTPVSSVSGPMDVRVINPDGGSAVAPSAFTYVTWLDTSWPCRLPISVSGSAAGPQTDTAVRVVLPYDEEMDTDFSDVRFSQVLAGVEAAIPFWLESFVPFTEAVFWVKVPSIPAAPDAASVYAYYGNPPAASLSDFGATFTRDFGESGLVGLWHFDDVPPLTTASDASGNGLAGTLLNFGLGPAWIGSDGGSWGSAGTGGFSAGNSILFDGADDTVDAGTSSLFTPTQGLTVEAWVQGSVPGVCGVERVIASKWGVKTNFRTGWEAASPPAARGGYGGAAFDGQYVYFVPYRDASGFHGEFLRFDTLSPFSSSGSWETCDPGQSALGSSLAGYVGAVFDGAFLYFANAGSDGHVLRYDTRLPFESQNSWTAWDPSDHGVGVLPKGYFGALFDGRFIYFSPSVNLGGPHGEVLRYDTCSSFTNASSWASVDPSTLGFQSHPTSNPRGYRGALFDGRYAYFSPYSNGYGNHGEVLRYDTQGSFFAASSWKSFDPEWIPAGKDPDGYSGAAFDGRYVYFAPDFNGAANHGEVLRLDTLQDFEQGTAWATFDPGAPTSAPWTALTSLGMATPRWNLGSAIHPDTGVIFLVGGENGTGSALDGVERFDPGTLAWLPPGAAMPSGKRSFGCAAGYVSSSPTPADCRIYAVGGHSGFSIVGSVDVYNPATDTWSSGAGLPTPRFRLGCVAAGGRIYAVGGNGGSGSLAAVEAYDPVADTWSAKAAMPTAREGLACSAVGGKVYAVGGYDGGSYLSTLEIYDVATDTWTSGRDMPVARSDFACRAAGAPARIYAVGGVNSDVPLASVNEYDPANDTWLQKTDMPTMRYGVGSAVRSSVLYVFGGRDTSALGTVETYDPSKEGIGSRPVGYQGAVFDGRYVVFVPHFRGDSYHGEALRLDTGGTFADRASWSAFDPVFSGHGYCGAVSDGRHIYFAPANGRQVARFDTLGGQGSYKLSFSQSGQEGAFSGSPPGFRALVNTARGLFGVSSPGDLSPGAWRHVAMTYDLSTLRLYLDGVLAGAVPASGALQACSAPFRIGSFASGTAVGSGTPFAGAMDEVRVHERALPAGEILAHCQRRKWADPESAASVAGPEERR